MKNSQVDSITKQKLLELERRLKKANSGVERALDEDIAMIAHIQKQEDTFLLGQQNMSRSFSNSRRSSLETPLTAKPNEENEESNLNMSRVSSESVISPKQLFPSDPSPGALASNVRLSTTPDINLTFIRKVNVAQEEKIRSIMGGMKSSMKRRGSF